MIKNLISIFIIAFFLFIAFGSGDDEKKSNDITSSEEVQEAKAGETVSVGDFVYMVNGARYFKAVGGEYSRKRADGIFLVISLLLKNQDNEAHTLDNSLFKLTDSQGTEYESSVDGTTALEMNGDKTLFYKQCNPKIQKQGLLCFEVPDRGVYYLHLSGGMWSGKTAVVNLSK